MPTPDIIRALMSKLAGVRQPSGQLVFNPNPGDWWGSWHGPPSEGGPGAGTGRNTHLYGSPNQSLYGTSGRVPTLGLIQSEATPFLRRESHLGTVTDPTARFQDIEAINALIRSARGRGIPGYTFDPAANRMHDPHYGKNDPTNPYYWQQFNTPGTSQALLDIQNRWNARRARRKR